MRAPLAVDLCCGLGGWSEGLLAEGWDCIGFDIERHEYGEHRYPAQLVLQDILTLDGRQFRGKVSLIVASPPCQFFSYTAMPWSRAKQLAADVRADPVRLEKELALFNACVRIGREAECPIVIENVVGAQKWVGRAKWHYGSYYLWGDVPALMPMAGGRKAMKVGVSHRESTNFHQGKYDDSTKVGGFTWSDHGKPGYVAKALNHEAERATKNGGGSWFNVAHNTTSGHGQNPVHDGVKQAGISGPRANGKGDRWFQDGAAASGSKSSARKAASARIAKIPFALASHIARVYKPAREAVA